MKKTIFLIIFVLYMICGCQRNQLNQGGTQSSDNSWLWQRLLKGAKAGLSSYAYGPSGALALKLAEIEKENKSCNNSNMDTYYQLEQLRLQEEALRLQREELEFKRLNGGKEY